MLEPLDEATGIDLLKRRDLRSARGAVGNLVDPSARAVNAGALVTLPCVAPIQDINAAVRAVAQFQAAEPRIAREEKVRSVTPDITRAAAFENVFVDAPAVQIQGEEAASIRCRP